MSDLHVYLITDNTYSMGQACLSSKASSAEVVAVGNLVTGSKCVSVGVIGDYDIHTPGYECGGYSLLEPDMFSAEEQQKWFDKHMTPSGGGGEPEAYKTALNFLLRKKPGIVFLFLDALPHGVATVLDQEGKREAEFLKNNNMIQDWQELTAALRNAGFCVVTFVTGNLFIKNNSHRKVYVELGYVVEIKVNKSAVITNTMLQTLFALLGQQQSSTNIVYDYWDAVTNTMCTTTHLKPFVQLDLRQLMQAANPTNVIGVFDALLDPKQPEKSRCLTTNPIIGKYWRLVCGSYRARENGKYETQCQQTINKLSQLINAITDTNERTFMQNWISESHDDVDQILELISTNFQSPATQVLVLSTTSITRDDVLELGRGGDFQKLAFAIAEIELVSSHPAAEIKNNDCPTFVPYSDEMKALDCMRLVGNLLSHRMLLSKKVALLAAILALKNKFLAKHALNALKENIGKWIDWTLDADGKQSSPIFWSLNFMNLLKLAPDEVLTVDEKKFRDHYHNVSHLSRIQNANIEIEVPLILDTPRRNVTWKRLCGSCQIARCFTMFPGNSQRCGLCIALDPSGRYYTQNLEISNQYGHSMDSKQYSEPSNTETNWAQCHVCHANYGVIDLKHLNVRTKCHACRTGEQNETVTCKFCKHKYSSPAGSAMLAMKAALGTTTTDDDEGFVCPRCTHNHTAMTTEVAFKLSEFIAENPSVRQWLPNNYNDMMDEKVKFWKRVHNTSCSCWSEEDEHKSLPTLFYKDFPILDQEACIAKFREMIVNTECAKAVCIMCLNDTPVAAMTPCCGLCPNTMCILCTRKWYSQVIVGGPIAQNHTQCPFCKSVPTFDVIRHFSLRHVRNIRTTRKNKGQNLCMWDPHFLYAVCADCKCAKPAIPIECAVADDDNRLEIRDFQCQSCADSKSLLLLQSASDAPRTKLCPGCHASTSKAGGCNHITCSQCHTHWCWSCGLGADPTTCIAFTSISIYPHMRSCGGIWPQREPVANDNTDNEDSE